MRNPDIAEPQTAEAALWLGSVDDLHDAVVMTISCALAGGMLLLAYWLNVRAANELQRQIDVLAEQAAWRWC
jgi:hypothetical protein